jgi:cytochrome c oxidase assembly factor CtaG
MFSHHLIAVMLVIFVAPLIAVLTLGLEAIRKHTDKQA